MKKLITIIGLAISIVGAKASLWDGVISIYSDVKAAAPVTNFAAVAYGTYAKDAPTKVGGGALLIYNVNNNIGVGAGIDWLGHFSQFSGNVTFKLPLHPGRLIASSGFLYDLTVVPNALTGLAAPLSGTDSTISTILGGGVAIPIAHVGKGAIDIGVEFVKWSNAGAYSGLHEEFFLAYRLGF